MNTRNKFILGIVMVLFIGAIIFPFQKTTIPEWKVVVTDRLGNPQSNIATRETWSSNREANEETLITNSEGIVIFPERKICRPLFIYAINKIVEKIDSFIIFHGSSSEARANVFPASGARSNILSYSEGKTLEQKLILIDYP